MFSERAFFSFVDLEPGSDHRAYNEWHQLDHLPENLALPGVAWGDRWARTAECADVAGADGAAREYAGVDYIAMYWFHPPYTESVREWKELGEESFQWGRGPGIPGVHRRLTAFFTPVKGYVAPHVPVSAATLPLRPNSGLHLRVSRFRDHHGYGAHEHHTWQDRVRIPDLMAVDGVAGAWTFSFREGAHHPTLAFDDSEEYAPGELRVRLLYLDGDPVETGKAIAEHEAQCDADGRGRPSAAVEECLLSSPLRSITPWRDW